jgi:hypothetical protein
MKLNLVVAALLSSLIAISTAQARGPYGSINVGNWKGGAYTNDQTGEFTHCAAGAGYDSGIYFMVTVDQGAGWALGFHNPKRTLTGNQTFQIALTFDGQRPFNVQGAAISANLIRVPMPVDSTLIAEFRKAKAMTAFTQGQLFPVQTRSNGRCCRPWPIASQWLSSRASRTRATFPSSLHRSRSPPRQRRQPLPEEA